MTDPDVLTALIGHTGFVGSNLAAARRFDRRYNSKTIGEIEGETFSEVVCAGVSAVKWWANKHPEQDWAGIVRLMDALRTVKARRFVLISTIDVYRDPRKVDEEDDPAAEPQHPYGRHRSLLETFVSERFAERMIVRLPALFGPGLKKNALYDLTHDNQLEVIHPQSKLQWYPIARLAQDLETWRAAGIGLLNVVTTPVEMEQIRRRFFPGSVIGGGAASPACYDVRTRHDARLGGHSGYLLQATEVLNAMELYLRGAA